MAAPNEVSIDDLSGVYVLDKSLSSDADPMLVVQGIGWIVRKAVGLATVTTTLKQFLGATPETSAPIVQIDVTQATGTGLGGTSDVRYMDWEGRAAEDHIFGKTTGKSRFVGGQEVDGKTRPAVEIQTKIEDPNVAKFLRGEIGPDLQPTEGFLVEKSEKEYPGAKGENGLWIQVVVENREGKWLAEQVWGFEMINNERRYTRRTVVSDPKGKYQLGRLVYTFKEHTAK